MAASSFQLGIKITADSKQAEQAMARTRDGLDAISRQLTVARNAFLALGGVMGMSAGVAGLARVADEVRSVNARLRQATSSMQEFAAAQRLALDLSAKTGAGYEAIASMYARLSMAAKSYGLSQQQVASITSATANALKVSGASAGEAAAVITQLSQALGSGVLRGDEFNSIMENGGALAKALADGLGVPIGKLRQLAEQGLLTTDIVAAALESQREKLEAAAAAMPRTIGQSLVAMRDAFGQAVVQLDQSIGASQAAIHVFDALARNMQSIVAVGLPTALAGVAVMLGRVAGAGASYLGGVYKQIVADQQARASAISLAAARLDYAKAEFAAAQATVASTTGMARLTAVENVLVPAQQRLAAAQQELNVAQAEGAVATRALNLAIAGLGGPLGIVVTLLTAGISAWALWGDKAEEAGNRAKTAAEKARDAIEQANQARDRLQREAKYGTGDAGTLREGIDASARQIEAKTRELIAAQREAERAQQQIRYAREGGEVAAVAAYQRQLDRVKAIRAELAQLQRDREANIAQLSRVQSGDGQSAPGAPTKAQRMLAEQQWNQYLQQFRSNKQKLADEIKQLQELAKQRGLSLDSKEYKDAEAAIRAKFEKKEAGGIASASARDFLDVARAQSEAEYSLLKDSLDRQLAALDESLQDRLLSVRDYYARKTQIELQENAAEQERQRALIADLQKTAANAKPGERERALADIINAQAQLEILARKAKDIPKAAARAQLKDELASIQEQMQRAQAIVQAAEQSAQSRVAIGLETQAQARRQVTETIRAQGQALARDLIPQIERLLAVATDPVVIAQLAATLDKIRQMQAEGSRTGAFDGISQAVRDYADKASDAFQTARDAATRAFQGIEDALTDLVVKGKADFRGLVVSILADLARLQLQKGLSRLFDVVGTAIGVKTNAVGGVYSSPSLSAYSGGVYDSPRVFAFAHGIGVFGEAGPEAIMPLKRGRDGKLGVVAQGGTAGNITVNVHVDATSQPGDIRGDARGIDLGRRIQAAVRAVLVDERRPGGLLAGG
jgi:lambda family phage tail tape measure protein